MSILLVPNPTILDGTGDCHVPLGLLGIAKALSDGGFDAEILDLNTMPAQRQTSEGDDAFIGGSRQ